MDQQAKHPKPTRVSDVIAFFLQIRASLSGDPRYDYYMAYLDVFREAQANGLDSVTTSPGRDEVDRLVSLLLGFVESKSFYAHGASYAGATCVIAQILSLADRDAASSRFRVLRASEHSDLIEFFYWDLGALTYFGADEINYSKLEPDISDLVGGLAPLQLPLTANTMAVGVSMDENFFRIYSPLLYLYAQQLPQFDFNFILCAESEQAEALMHEGAAYAQALASLNRSGEPSNVRVYAIPTPSFVRDPKTFYACARFFALPELLKHYPQVYLMDADLYLEDNPTAFFRRLRSVPCAAPATVGPSGLPPWRRYMAGNIAANRSCTESSFLDDLHAYIVHGLRQPRSWMLDQNALSFAIERSGPDSFTSLNTFKRPFITAKFMSTWESNYRRRNSTLRDKHSSNEG